MQICVNELASAGPTSKHSDGRNFITHFICSIYSTKTTRDIGNKLRNVVFLFQQRKRQQRFIQ